MSSIKPFRLLLWLALAGLTVAAAVLLAIAGLQARDCPPSAEPSACAVVNLAPSTITADFFVGDQLVASGVSSAHIPVRPGQPVRVDVRNFHENNPEFSNSYTYDDAFVDVLVPVGASQTYVLAPEVHYLKGFLKFTCEIGGQKIGDDIACLPLIDGTPRPALSANASQLYALTPGSHQLHVQAAGALADLWLPAGDDQRVDIIGGQTANLTAAFNKKVLLIVRLSEPGVKGDLYVDGESIGVGVSTAQTWVEPDKSYQINGFSFDDPKANGMYKWKDAMMIAEVGSPEQMEVTLPLEQQSMTGLVSVTCQLSRPDSSNSLQCLIPVDGATPVQASPGQAVEIEVKAGEHTVAVGLKGANSSAWVTPAPTKVTVTAGGTTSVTFTVRPAPTPGPTSAPLPPPPPPSQLHQPTLSGVDAHVREIFQQGQTLGRDPHRFSKVGDCETDSPYFLIPFDNNYYDLADYRYLRPILTVFSGSFGRKSVAGHGSFVVASVLDSTWADTTVCLPGETPLACEYRVYNPAYALIMLRTFPYPFETPQRTQYYANMATVISYTIKQGIVPVVSTIPLIETSPDELKEMNNVIRQLAVEYDIPLWDFYATTSTLPDNGVKDSHLTVPPDGATFFKGDTFEYGMTYRNLEALQVLYALKSSTQ